ncbi:hybrid sensor histidine kinase/response regulator [Streptomyces genisteinicus]|uniref:Circadian input-output histidine kinase CikA n=1 Tax=Streptomyces genisteinicus TaxID=2768068 RepID=A0A7H0HMY2_9ACTN|nr:HAMP domain-containing protein [Streptomyces genisteinicus]QNP61898.1 HAMP domain-containing protein [Streptomyces genisteinicus]
MDASAPGPGPEAGRESAAASEEALRRLLDGLVAVRDGDLSVRLPGDTSPLLSEVAAVYNGMVDQLSLVTSEVTRVAREVGGQGLLGGQARAPRVSGAWSELTSGVNTMADNLTSQVRAIAQVATAVARGDLTQKIRVDARGEILELKETINTMVDRLSSFAEEVSRVAREVGTEGSLGGQATVLGVSGTWKDLTDNVNSMATNLTNQVRNIAQVTTAVARGDLTRKIDVDARGEILELKTTVNTMVDQLSSFAAEVTRVAREVGSEGRLGGQAEVEGVSGTWKRLTANVNELAGNLTRQVRAIAEVTGAVAEGDLTRSITVEAPGEVGELKDNINAMVESLRATTRANEEQDWLKTHLAAMSDRMQGARSVDALATRIMEEVPPLVRAEYGGFFLARDGAGGRELVLTASYGSPDPPGAPRRVFGVGQGLVGQAARSCRPVEVDDLPAGYATVTSGTGSADATHLLVLPVVLEGQVLAVVELAALRPFTGVHRDFLHRLTESVGVNVGTLAANSRTDELLGKSQRLTAELSTRSQQLTARQEELQRSNAELKEKAALLADRNRDIERKNLEIEQARQELEARAQQLSRTSMYKSEFLANMSHELRTPLNSLLILAQLLAQNLDGNLTAKQVDYAEVIHSAGADLLQLINDILDLSKVEAGKMPVHFAEFALQELVEYVEATFRPVAGERDLTFEVAAEPGTPATLVTDEARLRQILRNLLSNALKFTDRGTVELRVAAAADSEVPAVLRDAGPVVAFHVCDTGIGIPADRLESMFGAFQQGDGTTSRHYGGTGLGLSISREVAKLLGGAIDVRSTPGRGSRFTLYLPAGGRGGSSDASVLAVEERGAPAAPPAGAVPVPGGRAVLLVDDDSRNVFALTEVLTGAGIRVLTADNGADGIALLRGSEDVGLVVMDVMMAGMDGYAAIAAIRELPRNARVPVIVVTAKAMAGDREEALAAGADDWVAKPVDTARLLAMISERLGSGPG